MTKPKAKQPIESFDPRFMQLLIAGARGRIVIPFLGEGGKAKAHLFQRRIHTLRVRMRQADHEHANLVTRAGTRLFWGAKAIEENLTADALFAEDHSGHLGAFLVIEPNDLRFEDVFAKMNLPGFDSQAAPAPKIVDEGEMDLEAMLASIKEE